MEKLIYRIEIFKIPGNSRRELRKPREFLDSVHIRDRDSLVTACVVWQVSLSYIVAFVLTC